MVGLKNFYEVNGYPDAYQGYDEVWVVMRYPKDMSPGFRHVPELAPPYELFKWFQDTKRGGRMMRTAFEEFYVPGYINCLITNPKARNALVSLEAELNRGRSIALVCTCYDESLCHRSVLGGILSYLGYNCETKSGTDYDRYGAMYIAALENSAITKS